MYDEKEEKGRRWKKREEKAEEAEGLEEEEENKLKHCPVAQTSALPLHRFLGSRRHVSPLFHGNRQQQSEINKLPSLLFSWPPTLGYHLLLPKNLKVSLLSYTTIIWRQWFPGV